MQLSRDFIKSNNVKAIAFDFDDTLVDEKCWIENRWEKTIVFAEKELHIEDFGKCFWKIFKNKGPKYRYHVNDTLTQLKQTRQVVKPIVDNFLSQTTEEHLFVGVVECLNFLRGNYKLGLVTNGKKETQLNRIKKAGIYDFFDAIICAWERPKPALEPYIACLRKLGVPGNEAIYVGGDPEIDLKGAKRLGLITICFNPQKCAKPEEADIVISS